MKLRPYQEAAIESVVQGWGKHQGMLLVLPTGTGKTVIFADLIRRLKTGRALVLAHRRELVRQAADKIAAISGDEPEIEMASSRADMGFLRAKCVVSSVQTMIKRKQRFDPGEFRLVIIDEAHHSAARSYREIIEHYAANPQCRVIGVTATPDRADNQGLRAVFEEAVFNYQLPDAIDDGWLVPVRQHMVEVHDLDLSQVKTVAGDFNQRQLAAVMEQERAVHEVVAPTLDIVGDRCAIVFCASIDQAEAVEVLLNRYRPGCATVIHSKLDDDLRHDRVRAWRQGDHNFLVNVGILTEGFDHPGVEYVVIARPTKSRSLYAQMVGRGTRPVVGHELNAPGLTDADRRRLIRDSPKPECHVIDFIGQAGRHSLVCTGDLLGPHASESVRHRAARIMREEGVTDPDEALQRAEWDEERYQRELAELEAEKARERERRHVKAKADYSMTEVTAFTMAGIEKPVRRQSERTQATEAQLKMLERFGVEIHPDTDRRQASQIIDTILERKREGLCTFKQMRLLKKHGVDATDMSFEAAGALISNLKANGWKRITAKV